MSKYLLIIGLIFNFFCKEKESIITIVDIGHHDRIGIANELSIINKYSPRVVGLDFYLTTDSLEKDNQLIKLFLSTQNLVLATMLHDNHVIHTNNWDSLEQSHEKFRFGNQGFSNVTITDDSVIVRQLPMRQNYKNRIEFAFSYMIASRYNSDKIQSKYKDENRLWDFSFDNDSFGYNFKVISVKDLMTENFDKNDITDKIVLMGHTSDPDYSFYLDRERTRKISGTEIQASFIREILN